MATERYVLGRALALVTVAAIVLTDCGGGDAEESPTEPTVPWLADAGDSAPSAPRRAAVRSGDLDDPTVTTRKDARIDDLCGLVTVDDLRAAGLRQITKPPSPMGHRGCGVQGGVAIVLFGFTELGHHETFPPLGRPFAIEGNTAVTMAARSDDTTVSYVAVDDDTLLGVVVSAPEPPPRELGAASRELLEVAFARLPAA